MRGLLILGMTLTAAFGGEPPYRDRVLTETQARAELALVRRAMEVIHPGYQRYTGAAAWEAEWRRLDQIARGGAPALELYLELSRALTLVRCDHTKAEAPEAFAEYRRRQPTYLPFHFKLFDGRMYVAHAAEHAAVLAPRTEILAIDGQPVATLIDEAISLVPVDGYTNHVRALSVEFSSEFLGSAFDHFHPLIHGIKHQFTIDFRTPASPERQSASLAAATLPDWLALARPKRNRYINFADTVTYKKIDPRTAYLEIQTFVNYRRPVDPEQKLRPLFQDMRNAGVKHLILDLRRNGGGSSGPALTLLRLLANRPFTMVRSDQLKSIDFSELKPYLSTWEKRLLDPDPSLLERLDSGYWEIKAEVDPSGRTEQQPLPEAFQGRLTVLMGRGNSSGTAMILAHLKDMKRGYLIGEPSGGSAEGTTAGVLFFLKLPHSGVTVRVPAKRNYLDVDPRNFERGMGVAPDLLAKPTVDDFFNGRDPVLEAALSRPAVDKRR